MESCQSESRSAQQKQNTYDSIKLNESHEKPSSWRLIYILELYC